MSDALTVGLTEDQRELLLRGLKFVRSSVMLEITDPGPEVDEQRQTQLKEINRLVEQLNGAPAPRAKG